MTKNLIELGGNVYDTKTGKVIEQQAVARQTTGAHKIVATPVLDGFVKKKPQQRSHSHHQPTQARKPTHKSQTLMRSSVKKPAAPSPASNPDTSIQPIKKQARTNLLRLERAARVAKSDLIRKFHLSAPSETSPANSSGQKPVVSPTTPPAVQPGPPPMHAAAVANEYALKSSSQAIQVEATIANATSHEQTYDAPKQGRFNRLIRTLTDLPQTVRYGVIGVVAVTGLLLTGYSLLPQASMRLATSRAGIQTSMPRYTPAGFQLERDITYEPGHLAYSYKSNADNRSFTIQKEATDWNSELLRTNYVTEQGLYQTISSNGKTIYLYNQSDAVWVDGGVWYKIQGASTLSTDQILRIANSF